MESKPKPPVEYSPQNWRNRAQFDEAVEEYKMELQAYHIAQALKKNSDPYCEYTINDVSLLIAEQLKAERARLRAVVEGMKGPGLNMDTLSCLKCGGYDDCDCEAKNEALDDVLQLLSEEEEQ